MARLIGLRSAWRTTIAALIALTLGSSAAAQEPDIFAACAPTTPAPTCKALDRLLLGCASARATESERNETALNCKMAVLDRLWKESAQIADSDRRQYAQAQLMMLSNAILDDFRRGASSRMPSNHTEGFVAAPAQDGVRVYNESQCIGAVVNGQCHGSIMPDAAYHPTCHGEMLNGMCTGPMF
ncbi:MAG TPA: hypothetical protein VHY34_11975 [Caulobacteraceae bacterium]|jgi:hypothetical protein|nr:hypothetical protein [Caulobacteraceae bacterium]